MVYNHNQSLQDYILRKNFEPTSVNDFPLAQVLTSIQDGVVVVDDEGVIVYANPSYTRILNVPVEKVIGRKMKNVEPNARILTVLETGEPILQEPIYLNSLKAEIVVDATPLYFEGKMIGGVTVFKRVREVVGYYKALSKLIEIKKQIHTKNHPNTTNTNSFNKLIGKDHHFLQIVDKASKVAASNATILITGENGVGKEIFAKAIHQASSRKYGPFIKINCAAIPDSLIESELFGYEKGAFTGAMKEGKKGKFELAHEGTIFLDEIGDMPKSVQAKLLRVLQEREFERVGGNQTIKLDIRVLAATHQNLKEMIISKQFREDLYYRINVMPIEIPPLRKRSADIGLLASHFTEKYSTFYNKQLILSKEVIAILQDYHWPGNVRELMNVIEHAVILCEDSIIHLQHLPEEFCTDSEKLIKDGLVSVEERNEELSEEHKRILLALEETQYNRTKAMKKLGVSRRTFYKKMKQYNIQLE